MPVIGLEYPNYFATAVYLGENINLNGDIILYEGKKYYVCDPTYIGASIGMAIPQYKNVNPIVFK